jgi:cobalt-zinc-cadmium efflux system membrane fusion protein
MNRVFAVLAMALVAVVTITACNKSTPTAVPTTRDASASHRVELSESAHAAGRIESAPVALTTRGPRLSLPAVIEAEPSQVARVGARVAGRVFALRARVGDTVERGAPLVEIDTVELHQVSSEFFIAQARMRQARDGLRRARALVADGVGAAADLRRAEADERVAAATLHESEEHLHFLGLGEREIQRLRAQSSHGNVRAIVRSPIAGRLSSLPVSIGQVVQGTETVAVIGDATRVWVVSRVFQSDLPKVRIGAAVSVQLEGDPRAGERSMTGVVESVSEVLDPETRTASARTSLVNTDRALRDGMTATAWIETDSESGLWVSELSVVERDGTRGVFVQTGPRSYEFRAVTVREGGGDRVAISEGIRPGEVVVTRGAFLLSAELDRAANGEED